VVVVVVVLGTLLVLERPLSGIMSEAVMVDVVVAVVAAAVEKVVAVDEDVMDSMYKGDADSVCNCCWRW